MNQYTPEQHDWLKANRPHMTQNQLAEAFNRRFGLNISGHALVSYCVRRGILTGRDGQFKAQGTPWNKGKKGYMGKNHTSFKKGNRPHTHRPVGSVRMNIDSCGRAYAEIKTAEPRTWEPYHRVVYRRAYGAIPADHAVIFKDGDNKNLHYSNLVAVKRSELARLVKYEFNQQPLEVRDSLIALVKVEQRMKELADK